MKITLKTVSATNLCRKKEIKQLRKRNLFIRERSININRNIFHNAHMMEVEILFLSIATVNFLHEKKNVVMHDFHAWFFLIDRRPLKHFGDNLTRLHLVWRDKPLEEKKNCTAIKNVPFYHQKVLDRQPRT